MHPAAAARPEVRLYVLDTGLIESSDFAMWSPNAGPGEYREMSVRSYLIAHPKGTVLWDTGIDDAIAELADGRRIADSIVFRVPRALRSQLAEIGIAPGGIDYLGLSHLHVDHVGNVALLPAATVLMQRAEYTARDYAEGAVREANVDLEQSRRSIATTKRIERELGAMVWLHHDRDAQRAVRAAPHHYE
jgi:glyoxylase-like metal-dependent hydrolase (beta-lactamase superfamily II)